MAAAKAVRTATKLSYGVTERYGAGYQLATGNKSKENRPILAATLAFRVATGATQPVTRL